MKRNRLPRVEAQQRRKRRKMIFKMAAKYSIDFQSDIFVILRIKKDSQIYLFNSTQTDNWPPSPAEFGTHTQNSLTPGG